MDKAPAKNRVFVKPPPTRQIRDVRAAGPDRMSRAGFYETSKSQ